MPFQNLIDFHTWCTKRKRLKNFVYYKIDSWPWVTSTLNQYVFQRYEFCTFETSFQEGKQNEMKGYECLIYLSLTKMHLNWIGQIYVEFYVKIQPQKMCFAVSRSSSFS